ncbi:hypothetical protein KD741_07560 [Escherichia coli]|uniref:tail fiber/spike domain-containing protein n=1 Tax=Escherichia coli TaxID=562 RepID=UPI001CEDF91F|nr:hypothetical protein [Escherichia coli]MCA6195386.1 hypothetical protein [Escherichia coli]
MTTQPTNLPVPSESPRDLKFNAGKIDEFVTSLVNTYVDRFGNEHYTIEGLRWLAQQAIAQFGWILIDSFQDGADITIPNQALRDEDTGEYYRWDGALPKHVDAGSTPATSGGVGVGAWVGIGDASLRAMLATVAGAGMIGTAHRGTLASDLNAIDRRPDGYGNSIPAVLANGDDVEINKNISISAATILDSGKHVRGVGGTITEATGLAAVLRADGFGVAAKEGITVSDIDAVGSVLSTDDTNESVESYGLFSYNSLYLRVMGMRASGLTGGVYLGQSRFAIASDITAHDMVYHPNLARGGYGVLTDGSKESIINNVSMEVGSGANGRHVLYMSTGGHGVVDANRNLIANNLIGRYNGKNDRNFPVIVVRKSERFIINNVIGEGANAGLAFNMANGEVSDYIISNHNYDLVKYADGVGVYGISQGDTPNPGNRWLISNSVIRVRPAAGLTSADCVAVSITHSNGLLSNLTCSIPNGSSPILIGDSATNVLINGVLDNVLPYDALTTAPLIAFTGSAASNIKVSGIKTSRPMFSRLAVVTDLTVDFDRKARITTNGSGGSTKIDSNEIIGTVSLSATAVTVNFPTHVTQNAVENVRVAGTAGAFQAFVTSYGAKSITLALYTAAGVLINPLTTSASFNVILTS